MKIRCARRADIPRVEICPGQRYREHDEKQNDPGNDEGGFCWHG
jgi:hypothetical protein